MKSVNGIVVVNNVSFSLERGKHLLVSFTNGEIIKGAYGDVNPWRYVQGFEAVLFEKGFTSQQIVEIKAVLVEEERQAREAKLQDFFKHGLR